MYNWYFHKMFDVIISVSSSDLVLFPSISLSGTQPNISMMKVHQQLSGHSWPELTFDMTFSFILPTVLYSSGGLLNPRRDLLNWGFLFVFFLSWNPFFIYKSHFTTDFTFFASSGEFFMVMWYFLFLVVVLFFWCINTCVYNHFRNGYLQE